jgi:hypothetical protein
MLSALPTMYIDASVLPELTDQDLKDLARCGGARHLASRRISLQASNRPGLSISVENKTVRPGLGALDVAPLGLADRGHWKLRLRTSSRAAALPIAPGLEMDPAQSVLEPVIRDERFVAIGRNGETEPLWGFVPVNYTPFGRFWRVVGKGLGEPGAHRFRKGADSTQTQQGWDKAVVAAGGDRSNEMGKKPNPMWEFRRAKKTMKSIVQFLLIIPEYVGA